MRVDAVAAGGAQLTTAPPRQHFRADIQGLRAIAVALVVLNHTFEWPLGGFVGVDVFYVISGFLITGLLTKEFDATGSISLRGFYARRVRRIVPAALLVLIVTTAAGFCLWFFPRSLQTLLDSVSAALFVSNWHFIAAGTDYLQSGGVTSPVQHYWSLSIEEQFYAVWPLALLALLQILHPSRRRLAAIVVGGIIASIGIAVYQTGLRPAAAYFDSFGRAWELLVGALIAILGTAGPRVPALARKSISWAGVGLIVAGAIIVTPEFSLPFPWVTPAVAGATLLIWANSRLGRWSLLRSRAVQWLGDVSYSLYLWHFPILTFAFSIFGRGWLTALSCLPIMLACSGLSRRFIELGVLHSDFLRKPSRVLSAVHFTAKDVLVGAVVLTVMAALSLAQLRGPGSLVSADALASHIGTARDARGRAVPSSREEDIRASLSATEWPPSISRQLDSLFAVQQAEAMGTQAPGCRNDVFSLAPANICSGDTASSTMVVGDSVALSWVPAVESATGGPVLAIGYANCSLYDVAVTNGVDSPGFREACTERRSEMLRLIEDRSPARVILSASETALTYTGLPLDEAGLEWRAGVARTLDLLRNVPEVVLLSNPPLTTSPIECATRITSPANCISEVSERYRVKAAAEASAAAQYPNAVFVDTRSWFCIGSSCPAFVGDSVLKTDASHLTMRAATEIGPLLAETLTP